MKTSGGSKHKKSRSHRSKRTKRSTAGMDGFGDLESAFRGLTMAPVNAAVDIGQGAIGATSDLAQGAVQGLRGATGAVVQGAQAVLPTGPAGPVITMGPQSADDELAALMGSMGSLTIGQRKKIREEIARRRSTRRSAKPTRFDPSSARKTATKAQTKRRKAAAKKAAATRQSLKAKGFKSLKDKRSAAARKGQATRRTNARFKSFGSDMASALDDLF